MRTAAQGSEGGTRGYGSDKQEPRGEGKEERKSGHMVGKTWDSKQILSKKLFLGPRRRKGRETRRSALKKLGNFEKRGEKGGAQGRAEGAERRSKMGKGKLGGDNPTQTKNWAPNGSGPWKII